MNVPSTTEQSRRRKAQDLIVRPFVIILMWRNVPPNAVTISGTLVAIATGTMFLFGHSRMAFWLLLLSGYCDMIDGSLARATGKESVFGKFLDSNLDRYSDIALYAGLLFFGVRSNDLLIMLFSFLALTTSYMTSYSRARAEGLGIKCEVGILGRERRYYLLLLGTLFTALDEPRWILFALILTAFFGAYTYWQRTMVVKEAS